MSEKRFSSNFYEEEGRTITDNGNELTQNEVVDLLNEQQTIINRLESENKQLREINKEIGDDLRGCRLNKNIIREKLKQWQEVHKEYNIYSIKDFEDLLDGLSKENEELKQRIALFEQQEDEFEQYTAQTIKYDSKLQR